VTVKLSPPLPAERTRWRQTPEANDPARIKALVDAAGMFSPEEVGIASDLVATTLDGTETYRFLFAEDGKGNLLGYSCFDRIPLSTGAFDLYWLVVDHALRGTGLALDLMRRTAKLVARRGGTQIFAETSSREPYAPARAFYRKAGFEEIARFEDFYDVGDAKIIFRIKL
jgi:ribosomal protein S18 acetylase RimI-like enzyme